VHLVASAIRFVLRPRENTSSGLAVFSALPIRVFHWCAKPGFLTPAITAGGLQILSVLLLFSSRQFEKLSSQFFKFLLYRFFSTVFPTVFSTVLSPLLSCKIPSSKLYRRRRLCRSEHRRSFSDEELAEILTYEELARLRVQFTMAARIVPAVYCPLPTFSGSKKEDLSEFIEAISICSRGRKAGCWGGQKAAGGACKHSKFAKNTRWDAQATIEKQCEICRVKDFYCTFICSLVQREVNF
jgi:hypothetical protein